MPLELPPAWRPWLAPRLSGDALARLSAFVDGERRRGPVYPPAGREFAALAAMAPVDVRVVILGQDPYHGAGQAHGLAFSVPRGVPRPPSLRNVVRELGDDLGVALDHGRGAPGDLGGWARQGVLLWNTVLTVRDGEAGAHRGCGWEEVTAAVLEAVQAAAAPVVFLLWGLPARKVAAGVDRDRHVVLESAHPSPLSARRGFFGSRPFSRANAALSAAGRGSIDWLAGLGDAAPAAR